ncbi:hypothetical protein [Planococcus sp. ISL-110]
MTEEVFYHASGSMPIKPILRQVF